MWDPVTSCMREAEDVKEVFRDWAAVLVDNEPTVHKVLLAGRSADEIEIAVLVEMLGLNVDSVQGFRDVSGCTGGRRQRVVGRRQS